MQLISIDFDMGVKMKELFTDLLKNQTISLIVIASLLALIAGSGGIVVGEFKLPLANNEWRLMISSFAIIILISAIFPVVYSKNSSSLANDNKSEDSILSNLYTALGLKPTPREDEVFQNFEIHRPGGNINAIQYLWADTYKGCKILAYIDNNDYFLRVEFDNVEPDSYPCNIAIRPQSEAPLKTNPEKRFLSFEARLADNSTGKVAVAVRVVNRYLQHWWYESHGGECIQFVVQDAAWKNYVLDLYDKNVWGIFDSDGYYKGGPTEPLFDIVGAVIFEFGMPNQTGRPRGGSGKIDIRRIKVTRNSG